MLYILDGSRLRGSLSNRSYSKYISNSNKACRKYERFVAFIVIALVIRLDVYMHLFCKTYWTKRCILIVGSLNHFYCCSSTFIFYFIFHYFGLFRSSVIANVITKIYSINFGRPIFSTALFSIPLLLNQFVQFSNHFTLQYLSYQNDQSQIKRTQTIQTDRSISTYSLLHFYSFEVQVR